MKATQPPRRAEAQARHGGSRALERTQKQQWPKRWTTWQIEAWHIISSDSKKMGSASPWVGSLADLKLKEFRNIDPAPKRGPRKYPGALPTGSPGWVAGGGGASGRKGKRRKGRGGERRVWQPSAHGRGSARTSSPADSEEIRIPAGRAQWISSPSP